MKRLALILAGLALGASVAHASIKNQPPGSGGGGGGSGTVTSVGLSSTGGTLTVTGSPVTTSGTIDAELGALTGDVTTTAGSLATSIGAGKVTLAKQANLAADSIQCNPSNSAATPAACNPLAVANLMGAQIAAQAGPITFASGNVAYGTYTYDGVTLTDGMVVLSAGTTATYTCGAGTDSTGKNGAVTGNPCGGLWIVKAGAAWVRPVNFPSGYVIAANCNLTVFIEQGTAHQGHTYRLTTSSAVTIDTSAALFSDSTIGNATATAVGTVYVSDAAGVAAHQYAALVQAPPTATGDCASFITGNDGALHGSIADPNGQACTYADANGHPVFSNFSSPAVTGSGCSLAANSYDNTGAIVATGADTCTLTFGGSFTVSQPFCVATGYNATVLPRISTAPTATAVIFATAAAGTFAYHCL